MKYPQKIDSFDILGVRINSLTRMLTIEVIEHWIKHNIRDYIVLTGVHGIIEMQKDKHLRNINNSAGLVTPDGMPVVLLGKSKGFSPLEKVYAPDIMMDTFKISSKCCYKHFLYGGKDGVADKLANTLRQQYPGIQIVGTYCPPFRPLTDEEIDDVTHQINESEADIVWCGLGCPKQERWMERFRPLLKAPVLIGVGAGFDFLSGEKPLAPKWVQHSGFEWFYRMLSDPKRLWKRYSSIVPKFIYLVVADILRHHYISFTRKQN